MTNWICFANSLKDFIKPDYLLLNNSNSEESFNVSAENKKIKQRKSPITPSATNP
jgi:hypothetical protein